MKNFMGKVERASKIEDMKKANRKQRRFLAAVTNKIVQKDIIAQGQNSATDNA